MRAKNSGYFPAFDRSPTASVVVSPALLRLLDNDVATPAGPGRAQIAFGKICATGADGNCGLAARSYGRDS
jgi:hypothetical protein